MVEIFQIILRFAIAAFALIASAAKAVFGRWWKVDPVSTLLTVGMLVITLLAKNSWLMLLWFGAAICLSIAAVCNWEWNLLADLQQIRQRGVAAFFRKSAAAAAEPPAAQDAAPSRIQVVGEPREQASVEESQVATVRRVSTLLESRIIGQPQAVEAVVSGLEAIAAGTRANTERPLSFMMIGPTGTGKTEMAKLTASGLQYHFYVVPMEEHKGKEGLWQLLGSPQGYHGGEGMLTREVTTYPQSVLLFDELEKGAPEMYDVFLRMLDEGKVRDRRSDRDVEFCRCIVFFTSNLVTAFPRNVGQNELRDLIQRTGLLRQELVARTGSIVPFHAFAPEDMHKITELQIVGYLEQVCQNRNTSPEITVQRGVIELLASKQDHRYGARNVTSSIEQYLEPRLRKALLAHGRSPITSLQVDAQNEHILVTVH